VQSAFRAFRHVGCVRLTHADNVPLLILPEDTCCRRCDRVHGNEPHTFDRTDQDPHFSGYPRRRPASCGPGCLPPLRRGHVRGSLLFVLPRRPLAHAVHTLSPWLGAMCLADIASIAVGTHPAVTLERAGHLFNLATRVLANPAFMPGPDDPSTPTWLGVRGR
jgi:hypothetical protein